MQESVAGRFSATLAAAGEKRCVCSQRSPAVRVFFLGESRCDRCCRDDAKAFSGGGWSWTTRPAAHYSPPIAIYQCASDSFYSP